MKTWHPEVFSTKGSEKDAWEKKIAALPAGDIFYAPEYLMAYERCPPCEARINFGGNALLFVFGDEDDFIVHPVFKRDLRDLPFWAKAQEPSFDIVSPYGYGGPVSHVSHPDLTEQLWAAFLDEFHAFCVRNGVVSEFVRLNPLLNNHKQLSHVTKGVVDTGAVVSMDLRFDEDRLWRNLEKANRNIIARARRQEIKIIRTKKHEDLDEFYEIYNATMDRRDAKKMYYFPREFYTLLFDLLDDKVSLFVARHGDRAICASLFIGDGGFMHYFLSGMRPDARYPGSNNLLLYEAILWAKKEGYRTFNLGGGYREGDSLFNFKSSFSKTTSTFYTYRKVHNGDRYQALCDARDNYDRSHGRDLVQSDYFPNYRK